MHSGAAASPAPDDFGPTAEALPAECLGEALAALIAGPDLVAPSDRDTATAV